MHPPFCCNYAGVQCKTPSLPCPARPPPTHQMQAVRWIKAREGRALEGKVKTFSDPDFLKQLELAITYGAAFLLENCDEYIDPVVDPVLERALTPAPGGRMVRLRDEGAGGGEGRAVRHGRGLGRGPVAGC